MIALLEVECHHLAEKLAAIRKRIFSLIFIFILGLIFITFGLIGFSLMIIHTWGENHLIESLGSLSLLYIISGVFLVHKTLKCMT